jgi:hypothetical protein
MTDIKKVNVIKIPNSDQGEIPSKKFPRMPRMYLELLENKDKIKPQLLNKEYDPTDADTIASFDETDEPDPFKNNLETVEEDEEEVDESSKSDNSDGSDNLSSISASDEEQTEKSNESGSVVDDDDDDDDVDVQSNISSLNSKKMEARNKLKEILEDDDFGEAPKLSDLPYQQKKNVPNIDQMPDPFSPEEEEDLKRELLFKFELLKKSYKNIDIPEFSIHSPLKKMNESYENLLRHVSLDSNVESYKNILIGGFMLFEFILGHWLKFDMSGFTQQQILNMSQYERLLIELGEKSYVPEGKQWPVEVRLLGMIIMNAVIFIVSKMIMKQTGSDLMSMMNHFKPSVQASINEPKKKMRGPTIDIDV